MKITRVFWMLMLVSLLCPIVPAQKPIVPIADLRIGGLLGGSRDGKWVEAGVAAEVIMNGGMDMFIFGFRGKEKETIPAVKRGPIDEPCEDFYNLQIGMDPRQGLGLGINATWNPMPRVPKRLSLQSRVYKDAVLSQLKTEKLSRSVANITQAFQIDLDGDGTDEVLIAATNIKREHGFGWGPGEYSFIMLRRVTKSGVRNYLLGGNFFKRGRDTGSAPNRYEISSIADLNGDGKMEIVIYWEYFEGGASGAFEMRGGKPEPIEELQVDCGL